MNVIILPLLAEGAHFLKNKSIKGVLVLTLVVLSLSTVFIQGYSRTYSLGMDLGHEAEWILDSAYDFFDEYITTRSLFVSEVEARKVFSLQHAVFQYPIADIYAFHVIGVFYKENYALIAIGTGLFLVNYQTETGVNYVKEMFSSIEWNINYNVTPIKKQTVIFTSFGGNLLNATVSYFLFNESDMHSISIWWKSNWTINYINLYGDLKVNTLKNYLVVQTVNITTLRSHGVFWSYFYEPKKPMSFWLMHFMIFDSLTSLQFYKYELMLIGILLIILNYIGIKPRIIKREQGKIE